MCFVLSFYYSIFVSRIAQPLTEQRTAEANSDGLGLEVVVESSLAELAANSRLLEPTKGNRVVNHVVLRGDVLVNSEVLKQLGMPWADWSRVSCWTAGNKKTYAVDPDGTGLEGVADADAGVEVLGVDGGGETVGGLVTELDGLLLSGELGDGADGAENLLLHNLHVGADVGEDGGLDEVALVAVALTTSLDLGTLVLAGLDVAHDAVVLKLANLRTLEGLGVKGVADGVGGRALLEGLEELVVDALLDKDASTSAAALAVVEVDAKVDPRDGGLDVGVVKDNVGGLAAELEGDLLEVGRSSSLEDGAADEGGTGKGDLVNVHVGRDGGTGSLAETRDQVEDTGGEASLFDELSKDEARERGLLSSLHDNGVAGGQGRANLPRQHEKGEVPGDNLTADTELDSQLASRLMLLI